MTVFLYCIKVLLVLAYSFEVLMVLVNSFEVLIVNSDRNGLTVHIDPPVGVVVHEIIPVLIAEKREFFFFF